MLRRLIDLWKNEEGPTTVEYALILVVIVIVAIATWTLLGQGVNNAVARTNAAVPFSGL